METSLACAELLGECIYQLVEYFVSPSSRLCFIYLIPVSLLIFLSDINRLRWKKNQHVIQRWFGRSAQQDYAFIGLNLVLKSLFFAHLIVIGIDLAQWTFLSLTHVIGHVRLSLSPPMIVASYTIVLMIIDDLSVYWLHRCMHHIPLLWSFHAIHHSATSLTPLTWLRIHPIEVLLNTVRKGFVYGLVTGVFMFLSGSAVHEITLLGVNIFSLIFFTLGANLRHSHIPLSYGNVMESILISPLQHQIHHSADPQHINHNFGAKLAVWDWLFGTLIKGKSIQAPLQFGNRSP